MSGAGLSPDADTNYRGHHSTEGQSNLLEDYVAEMSRSARNTGVERAQLSDPDGHEEAVAIILELAASGGSLTADDVRHRQRIGTPAVLGGAFGTARKLGLIRADGFELSKSASRHGAPVRRWVGRP